jgi:galactokinase
LPVSRASAYAPGRVELLGNHTDYNGGVVLAAAIDRGITVAGESRSDDVVRLHSQTLGRSFEMSVGRLERQAAEPWANYPLGVTHELLQRGYAIGGYDAEIDGDLPPGGGLSSSAALEVATACFLAKLCDLRIPAREIARLCRKAENDFVGVGSGLLDQITSVFGRADHVVYLDCADEEIRTLPFSPDVALVIADSGTKHSLVESQYDQRRRECAAAAVALGVPTLRSVSMQQLEQSGIDRVLFRRALHIVGENERVEEAVEFLRSGNANAIGELMNASHESSRVNFENSTPELDLLVSIARSLPEVLGARLTGGGFGGSIVALAKAGAAATAADVLTKRYATQTGCDAGAFVCRLADGAAIVNGLTAN